jgi:hypothetical protein
MKREAACGACCLLFFYIYQNKLNPGKLIKSWLPSEYAGPFPKNTLRLAAIPDWAVSYF